MLPYAEVTMSRGVLDVPWGVTSSEHWACTALYNASPVNSVRLAPPVKSVVAHIELILPAISNVPWVDNDLFLVLDNTALIPASVWAPLDVSDAFCWVNSPVLAVIMWLTSLAVLSITDRFRFLKS